MNEVRELAKILSDYGLSKLEYASGETRITLEKIVTAVTSNMQAAPVEIPAPATTESGSSGTTVTAPLVGVAYRSREPGAPPLAEVGSVVKKGDAVCIIEAMKMFSDIPAPCDGTVLEILFNDGELAEYGAPLLVIGA